MMLGRCAPRNNAMTVRAATVVVRSTRYVLMLGLFAGRICLPLNLAAAEVAPKRVRNGLRMNASSSRDVLVVDDNDGVREGIAEFLRHFGLDVATASNGREALDRLAESPYAVMLLDYEMPELNGLAVVDELRRHPTRPVVLMMTGVEAIDVLPIDGAIVQAVLRKPFELVRVAGIIRTCVNAARGHSVVPAAVGTTDQ